LTIATTLNRVTYNGDGTTLIFAYPFEIFLAGDLQVYDIVNATGVATLQTLGVNYTVSGAGLPTGGNVTMTVAPASGHTLLIIRVEPLTQASSLPANDKFPTSTVEAALDKLTMLAQQLSEVDSRCLKLALTSLYSNLTLPDPVASMLLRWKTDLSGLENATVTGQGTIVIPVAVNQGGTGAITAAAALTSLGAIAATLVTTKGDLITTTAPSTPGRKAVGADGHELIADSTQTDGLLWSIGRIPEHGRLKFSSGTALVFSPFKGTKLPVVTSGVWRLRDIGSGITSGSPVAAANFVNGVASQTLAANTTYLVTVFDNAGTLTFDFLTTLTHTQDATTGVEIKNGDNTRTVVGMIRTNATPNFEDDNALLGVLSWFNRRSRFITNPFTANRTTASASYTELNTEIRNNFLTWAEESVQFVFHAAITSDTNGGQVYSTLGVDSTTVAEDVYARAIVETANNPRDHVIGHFGSYSEGFHFATLLGKTNAGTATWAVDSNSAGLRPTLKVTVRG
jgi:hypothetical protein